MPTLKLIILKVQKYDDSGLRKAGSKGLASLISKTVKIVQFTKSELIRLSKYNHVGSNIRKF